MLVIAVEMPILPKIAMFGSKLRSVIVVAIRIDVTGICW
jgi:hypothetical protein